MIIRAYRPEDRETLERIHAEQAFTYPFPNLEDPTFFLKMVIEDDDGKVIQAIVLHLTAEAYFLGDKKAGSPQSRFDAFVRLHDECARLAYYPGGLSDIHAFLPPEVEKSFGRRLLKLGWVTEPWKPFVKFLKG